MAPNTDAISLATLGFSAIQTFKFIGFYKDAKYLNFYVHGKKNDSGFTAELNQFKFEFRIIGSYL
ncbi:hypothetical protein GCM10008085_14330 [Winogradskyella epiphytica]|nr:hypothetical protein GCM10008085_14330 [Winogradskyella epiphytica]